MVCGVVPKVVEYLDSRLALEAYQENDRTPPKVALLNGEPYFIAKSVRIAKEVEGIYKAQALILASLPQAPNYLSDDELTYLGN